MKDTLITDDRAKNLCLMGAGAACCSFLLIGPRGWMCAKQSDFEATIVERRANGSIGAKGDNCSGPPAFIPRKHDAG